MFMETRCLPKYARNNIFFCILQNNQIRTYMGVNLSQLHNFYSPWSNHVFFGNHHSVYQGEWIILNIHGIRKRCITLQKNNTILLNVTCDMQILHNITENSHLCMILISIWRIDWGNLLEVIGEKNTDHHHYVFIFVGLTRTLKLYETRSVNIGYLLLG